MIHTKNKIIAYLKRWASVVENSDFNKFCGIPTNALIEKEITDKSYLISFQGFFIKRLAILILHLITVSMAVYQRPNIKFSLVRGIKEGTGDITTEDVSRFKLPKE